MTWRIYALRTHRPQPNRTLQPLRKRAGAVLKEETLATPASAKFDVFLSHSSEDADTILGVKRIIESANLKVYVDWIDDAGLDRTSVTRSTADVLRNRMSNSSYLVYAHSENASDSRWMPWELGYFDGIKPKFIFILPLVRNLDSEFKGQEYLGLYPTVDKLSSLAGKVNLGFENVRVGANVRTFTMRDALETGMYLPVQTAN